MNKKRIFQKTFFITTFLFFSILLMRVVITSRGPVTNMYETVLFAGFIGLLLGIILRNSYYSLASLIFSLLSLGFVLFSKNMVSSKLENLRFVVTGSFDKYSRDEIEALVKNNGGAVQSAVNAKTSYLIVGVDAGSKLEKANKLGIKTISLADFEKML